MKWDIVIDFEISHGRKRIFSLRRLIPWLQKRHAEHKQWVRSCYGKTRYSSEHSARNAAWFKKHPAPFSVYPCEICDGFHITTKVRENT